MTAPASVGLYGKLPSHGDFLRRRLSDSFVATWDGWLQASIMASRATLADRWLEVYLTSPAWRFACAPGTCGATSVAGVVVPSVDRVGRHFPLAIVAELDLPEAAMLAAVVTEIEPFFEKAERLLVDTLAMQHVQFDGFDAQVAALDQELLPLQAPPRVVLDPTAGAVLAAGRETRWHIPCGALASPTPVLQQLLSRHLAAIYDPLGLWWTAGSSLVAPACLVMSGLPPPETFAALLDGSWAECHWISIPARVADDDTQLTEDTRSLHFRSAAAGDPGQSRNNSGDAFLERPDTGVWAVAEGFGGPDHGEMASRMACDALADLVPEASFDDMVKSAVRRLRQVNDYLRRAAPPASERGSTVVALLARDTQCGVLWAGGNNRAYRLRGGHFERLTRDHPLAGPDAVRQTSRHLTANAARDEPGPAVALRYDRVVRGDRFLLCSDGLTLAVPEAEIRAWMAAPEVGRSVEGLIQAAREHKARDDVTVLLVEACA